MRIFKKYITRLVFSGKFLGCANFGRNRGKKLVLGVMVMGVMGVMVSGVIFVCVSLLSILS